MLVPDLIKDQNVKLRLNHKNPTLTLNHTVCGAKICIIDIKRGPLGDCLQLLQTHIDIY